MYSNNADKVVCEILNPKYQKIVEKQTLFKTIKIKIEKL